ncbi:hypothetical protein Hdeb2414_s0007g00244701 [Helianthus debilis subsp. tardiflorus]
MKSPPLTRRKILTTSLLRRRSTRARRRLKNRSYSGESVLGNDVHVIDSKVKKTSAFGKVKKDEVRDGFEERVVQGLNCILVLELSRVLFEFEKLEGLGCVLTFFW